MTISLFWSGLCRRANRTQRGARSTHTLEGCFHARVARHRLIPAASSVRRVDADEAELGAHRERDERRRSSGRRDSTDRGHDAHARPGPRAAPLDLPQWQLEAGDTDSAGSRRSESDMSDSEIEAAERRAPPGRQQRRCPQHFARPRRHARTAKRHRLYGNIDPSQTSRGGAFREKTTATPTTCS